METSNVYRLNRDRISASQPALTAAARSSTAATPSSSIKSARRSEHATTVREPRKLYPLDQTVYLFHNKRHPAEMAEPEIARFLSNLATESR